MKKIEVNNLELVKATFDYEHKKLICDCLDNGRFKKSYYLPFKKLDSMEYKDMVLQVMEDGIKITHNE